MDFAFGGGAMPWAIPCPLEFPGLVRNPNRRSKKELREHRKTAERFIERTLYPYCKDIRREGPTPKFGGA
jgi:hypothetical protein